MPTSSIIHTRRLNEDFGTIDAQSVEYRLNNRKRLSTIGGNNSRTFAVELNNGSMIRVVVSSDQAEQFERDLSTAIEQNPNADVGNILYELTRFFDIFDIQWMGQFDDTSPVVEADDVPAADPVAQDPQDPTMGNATSTDSDTAPGDDEGNGNSDGMFDTNEPVDLNDLTDDDEPATDELDAPSLKDVLQTMISQLTADSEARKAEAEARKAEADAQKAQAVARAMEIKVGQEKEIQAMEDWESREKEKKTKDKELDRLAKFRLAQSQGLTDSRKLQVNEGALPASLSDADIREFVDFVEAELEDEPNAYPGGRTTRNVAKMSHVWAAKMVADRQMWKGYPVDQLASDLSEEFWHSLNEDTPLKQRGRALNEDWGSSDQSIAVGHMVDFIKQYHNGALTPDSIQAAAEDEAESLYDYFRDSEDGMSWQDVVDMLIRTFMRRWTAQGTEHLMTRYGKARVQESYVSRGRLAEGYVERIGEAAPAPQMMPHLRSLIQAMKGRPQANSQALDHVEDAALDMITDVTAQRSQANRDINDVRRSGGDAEEVRDEQQIAQLRMQFARKVSQLRQQFAQGVQRIHKQ